MHASALLLDGGATVEELVSKGAVRTEPLTGWAREDARSAAGGTGLLRLRLGGDPDGGLDDGRELDRWWIQHSHDGIAASGLHGRFRWRRWGWCFWRGGLSLDVLLEQPGQPTKHSRLR